MTENLPPEAERILGENEKRRGAAADDWLAAFNKKSNEALAKRAQRPRQMRARSSRRSPASRSPITTGFARRSPRRSASVSVLSMSGSRLFASRGWPTTFWSRTGR